MEICQVYEMEDLLSVASTRIATMYHNNPVSFLSPGLLQCTELFSEAALRIATMYHNNPVSSLSLGLLQFTESCSQASLRIATMYCNNSVSSLCLSSCSIGVMLHLLLSKGSFAECLLTLLQ